jgi:hypothetical protein
MLRPIWRWGKGMGAKVGVCAEPTYGSACCNGACVCGALVAVVGEPSSPMLFRTAPGSGWRKGRSKRGGEAVQRASGERR